MFLNQTEPDSFQTESEFILHIPTLCLLTGRQRIMAVYIVNHLDFRGIYSATSNNTKLVHWPLMGGYSAEGPLSSPLLAVPNVTTHPSTASVPITVLLYDGPLLCGFNVAIKGLTSSGITSEVVLLVVCKCRFVTVFVPL